MTAATNNRTHWDYGDLIEAPYVMPDPNKRGHFVSEPRKATITGFSAPDWVVRRNWGWLGDAFVEFEDGTKGSCALSYKAA